MLGYALPTLTQDLGMGTFTVPTTGKNFVALSSAALASTGFSTGVVVPMNPTTAVQNVAAGLGAILDAAIMDFASLGYARSGCVLLNLAASTPLTVDLTNLSAQSVYGGDRNFLTAIELRFVNTGANPVDVSPGASNPFAGPLKGTSPAFTVPAGSVERWHNKAGWGLSPSARNLKFDPGSSAATIACLIGGTF